MIDARVQQSTEQHLVQCDFITFPTRRQIQGAFMTQPNETAVHQTSRKHQNYPSASGYSSDSRVAA